MKPTGCPDFEVELPRPRPFDRLTVEPFDRSRLPGGSNDSTIQRTNDQTGISPAVVKAADFGFSEASTDNISATHATRDESRLTVTERLKRSLGTFL